jgi:hypothetical protein
MLTVVLLILLLVLLGGGFGYRSWGRGADWGGLDTLIGLLVLVLIIGLILNLLGAWRY